MVATVARKWGVARCQSCCGVGRCCTRTGTARWSLGVGEIDKVMLGEALTSEAVVEALDGGIVGRLAGATEVHAHLVPIAPVVDRDRCELGAVVALNDRRRSAFLAKLAEDRDHIIGA